MSGRNTPWSSGSSSTAVLHGSSLIEKSSRVTGIEPRTIDRFYTYTLHAGLPGPAGPGSQIMNLRRETAGNRSNVWSVTTRATVSVGLPAGLCNVVRV